MITAIISFLSGMLCRRGWWLGPLGLLVGQLTAFIVGPIWLHWPMNPMIGVGLVFIVVNAGENLVCGFLGLVARKMLAAWGILPALKTADPTRDPWKEPLEGESTDSTHTR